MGPGEVSNMIGFTKMNSERNVSPGFSSLFALLLYLLIDAYNQNLMIEDKISFFVSGICLLALLIHQLRNVWHTSTKSKSVER